MRLFSVEDAIFFLHSGHSAYCESSLPIRVFPESYWAPLAVASANDSLMVDEATSIAITDRELKVPDPDRPGPAAMNHQSSFSSSFFKCLVGVRSGRRS